MSLHLVPDVAPLDQPSGVEILAALPFAAYITDLDGRITAFNEAATNLWGRRPHLGEYWCGSLRLFHPDGQPLTHDECPMAMTLKTGVPVRGVEAMLERPDGSRVYFTPHPNLLKDQDGQVVGGFNMLMDINETSKAERTGQHFAAIVESSDDAIISKDLTGTIRSWNKGAERIFGYTAADAIGQHVSILIPEDRLNEEPGIIERIRRGERIEHYETIRQRKDGSKINISLTVSPVKNSVGQVIGASKIARDITDRKRAEEARELLLHEIKHRVKNSLGTVQAIASQTFREAPRAERDAFTGRLRALASAHDMLTRQDWDRVPVRQMVLRALEPFQENRAARFRVTGDDAILNANQALLLAMAIHELATNAVKYGALSNDDGVVTLNWRMEATGADQHLKLEWRESGGPPVGTPGRRGFGSTLIERALQQEQGRCGFRFEPDGVICTLEMKV